MQGSEWGDPLFTSDEDDDSFSVAKTPGAEAQQATDPFAPSFLCTCKDCSRKRNLENPLRAPLGRPVPDDLHTCSNLSRPPPITTRGTQTDETGDGDNSSITTKCKEGVPVSVMMLQYPLFFCDVDLPFTLELKRSWREIGGLAFWTLSSAKEGNGVQALRDNNSQTFWQSEGQAPHTISLQFNKEVNVTRVDLLVNFQQDESYTPKRVQIKLGSSPATLSVVRDLEFAATEDQHCWWGIELTPTHAIKLANGLENHSHDATLDLALAGVDTSEYLRGACLQIAVLTTHQQGRDTHIRQVRVYGPIEGAEDAEPLLRESTTARPSRPTIGTIAEDAVYALDLVGEGGQTPPLSSRLTSEHPVLSRAWSQDFLAALAGTQPAPP